MSKEDAMVVDTKWLRQELEGCTHIGWAANRLGFSSLDIGRNCGVHQFSDPGWWLVEIHTGLWQAFGIVCYLEVVAGDGVLIVNDRDDGYVDGPLHKLSEARHREYPSHAWLLSTGYVAVVVRLTRPPSS